MVSIAFGKRKVPSSKKVRSVKSSNPVEEASRHPNNRLHFNLLWKQDGFENACLLRGLGDGSRARSAVIECPCVDLKREDK